MMEYELAVVMPVYNEEDCICRVIDAWDDELSGLGIHFVMIVLNDGSRDNTAGRLCSYAGNPRVEVINKANSGHGPTILQGYGLALERADWVFQVDSDDEMSAVHFGTLWQQKEDFAALFGARGGRCQSSGRKLISLVSRLAVRSIFGAGVTDVNTPYRLLRSTLLRQIIPLIPVDTFAPNILISGVLAASGLPLLNVPIPHEGRKTGTASIVRWRLWRAAGLSLLQTIAFSARKVKVSWYDCRQ